MTPSVAPRNPNFASSENRGGVLGWSRRERTGGPGERARGGGLFRGESIATNVQIQRRSGGTARNIDRNSVSRWGGVGGFTLIIAGEGP